jgi:hypothetical protein
MAEVHPGSAPRDKREHPRFKVEGATTVVGKPGFLASLGIGPIRHSVVNLSEGGAMVRVGKSLPIGSRHELQIQVPKANEVIETVGEIRWCAQSARKDSDYYVGFRFVDLPAAERSKLSGMTERFAIPNDPSRKDALPPLDLNPPGA